MLTILHAAATLLMTGVVLCVAVVHYPLFAKVGREAWTAYEAAHVSAITLVVGPLMLAEVVLAVLLLVMPAAVPATSGGQASALWQAVTPSTLAWVGLGLLAICWGVTFAWSVPQHGQLAAGWNDATHAQLLWWNWVRTLAWCARSIVAVWMLALLISR